MATENKKSVALYPKSDDNIAAFVVSNNTICIGKIEAEDSYGFLFDALLALQMFEENSQVKFMFAPLVAAGRDPKTSKTFIPHTAIMCFYEMEDKLLNSYREVTNRIQIVGTLGHK